MTRSQKETVIIVHGTWADPVSGHDCWHQRSAGKTANFVSRLDDALQALGSPARCWRHCDPPSKIAPFVWCGENDWTDRTRASVELARYLDELQREGWRCHVVAHSHGGNVLLEALPAISATTGSVAGVNGTIITLGTPFIDAMGPIASRVDKQRKVMDVVAWLFYAFAVVVWIAALGIALAVHGGIGAFLSAGSWPYVAIGGLLGLAALGVGAYRRNQLRKGWTQFWDAVAKEPLSRNTFLAIGSTKDEAWQLLHHLRNVPNPLALELGLVRYLLKCRRESIQRSYEVAQIQGARPFRDLGWPAKIVAVVFHLVLLLVAFGLSFGLFFSSDAASEKWAGVAGFAIIMLIWFALVSCATFIFERSFYSALVSPLRWMGARARAIAEVPSEIVTYLLRRRGWFILQQMALGLEGYRYRLPSVEQKPLHGSKAFVRYENLPKAAEDMALARRGDWIKTHLGGISETLSKVVVTASDVSLLLKEVEKDLSLVHAAYYTQDECVERIAEWIAYGGLPPDQREAAQPAAVA